MPVLAVHSAAPASATVWIVDTNKPSIHIAARDAQFYERTNNLARFILTRLGDTSAYLSQVNVTYAGTAIQGAHFYGDAFATMSYGDETKDFFVYPIHDGVVTGPLTVTATVAAASDGSYTVGTPATSGAVTRVDADDVPETVLFADNFDTDSSANWTVRFAARNGIDDYSTTWAYDWFRSPSTANTPNDGVGGTWSYDSLWVSIEADASGTDDYMFLSAPTVAPAAIWGPTKYATAC
jgi:hypothetical protein